MFRSLTIAALAVTLTACATPQQQCIAQASKTLRHAERDVTRINGNLARGYAIHKSSFAVPEISTCYKSDGTPYTCRSIEQRTIETPVAIDVAEEKRKLAALKKLIQKEQPGVQKAAAACVAEFPE